MNGLRLKGVNALVMQMDELAHKANQRFMELSLVSDQSYTISELEKTHDDFIRECGGTLKKAEIAKTKEKLSSKKKSKRASHLLTKDYFEQGMSLEKIAEKRGLVKGTILSHILKLKEEFPDMNVDSIQPKKETLLEVKKAMDSTKNDSERRSQKFIYNFNHGELSYEDIKLALLFL